MDEIVKIMENLTIQPKQNIITYNMYTRYKTPQKCFCGGSAKLFKKHIESKKCKEYCKKHNIQIVVNTPPKKMGQTKEEKLKYRREYFKQYWKERPEKYKEHLEKMSVKRNENIEKFRQGVRDCRKRIKSGERIYTLTKLN